jgi:hypothetical protein
VLQLEDYDWVTGGHTALEQRGRGSSADAPSATHPPRSIILRVSCSIVASAGVQWPLHRTRLLAWSQARGVARSFIWALPQVARDGFTLF